MPREYLRADEEFDSTERELAHYGILRKSGRYPWGSGGTVNTRSRDFLSYKDEMRAKGLTEAEIAAGLSTPEHPFTTTMLREATTVARNARKAADIAQAEALKAKGYRNTKIGEIMGLNESSVRSLLKPGEMEKQDVLHRIANFLRDAVERLGAIDVGKGNEHDPSIGVARNKFDTAISILRNEGYAFHKVQVPQATGAGKTTIKVLAKKGTTYRELAENLDRIKPIGGWSEDGGISFTKAKPPLPLNPKRLAINYSEKNSKGEEIGGGLADGMIYVREGVPDLSLGKARYAQVRIQVGPKHYIKGMAMYSDDIPAGVDVVFNTNKSRTEAPTKLDALKELKIDKATGQVDEKLPFGSIVRQIGDRDETGEIKKVTSVMNLVNEQGDWAKWQDSISSQVLSKQRASLAKQQLDLAYEVRKNQLDEILQLSNPAVRKSLLEKFADEADSAAVEMKAHAMPRQGNHVIVPVNDLSPTEVYAPNFNHGERVVLIRHPHGGKFEIPELVVNNNHKTAKRLLGQAPDAIGINAEVAAKLSGADFDGDTVLVIPNNRGEISTKSALQGLKNFDPKDEYRPYDGMRTVDGGIYRAETGKVDYGARGRPTDHMQKQMGDISNLITDMTIRGASDAELARAVRHSMVVIDSQKHMLNYKLSAERNGIAALKEKYQKPYTEKGNAAASTLISRAKGDIRVPDRGQAKVDPATGAKVYGDPKTFVDKDGNIIVKTKSSVKLRETDDAHTLSSGTRIESVYADHSNRLKSLANQARKEWYHTPNVERSASAAKVYKDEVDSLVAKLKLAQSNAPKERQAQVLANTALKARQDANPDMDAAEVKKTSALLIAEMRSRLGAKRSPVYIEDREWEAIQAGAISNNMLNEILKNADIERVKTLATPRQRTVMTTVKQQRAASLLSTGMTQAEVAQILGVSLTTLKNSLAEGG